MKRHVLVVFGLMTLLALGTSAFAQTIQMKANIPFDFVVGNKALPAGEYVVKSAGISSQALVIQNVSSKQIATMLANEVESLQPSAGSKLVFHQYGGDYFLREVWGKDNARGRELPRSRHEEELAKATTDHSVIELGALR